MDFKDLLKQLADRTNKLKSSIATEEATKNAFIMPFIQVLGYDVFNPIEVVPEFVADIGIKKGEKVDYAIFKDKSPIMLIECKHWNQKLDIHDNQLIRYFNATKAKFGILTNGIEYRFYTDLIEPNIMDEKPFLDFNINDIKEQQIEQLKRFHKDYFNTNDILSQANEMKYITELKALFITEMQQPSEDFVRLFASKVYPKKITAPVVLQFSELLKKSIQYLINDTINDRLKAAIMPDIINEEVIEKKPTIETTQEELDSYSIVRKILNKTIDIDRITYKDTKTFFMINLDNNKDIIICKIYLNGIKKYLTTFNQQGIETKNEIQTIDDIYSFSDILVATVKQLIQWKMNMNKL